MNNLTNNQQELLSQLINEFNRMNESKKTSTGFNLIDINPLAKINQEIKEFNQLADADCIAWNNLANQEAQRIVDLLKQDLQGYCVQKYGKENGHYDLPSILIRHDEKTSTHCNSCVTINVEIEHQTKYIHDTPRNFGVKLYYVSTYGGTRYYTIEEAISDATFQRKLRNVVIR
jgi:hypothetical protein